MIPSNRWQQGELIELPITDLSDRGDGVGRFEQRVVFVPETVTGDRVQVRLLHVKPQYAYGKLVQILEPSPHRVRPSCIVADKCGGCQWQHVSDDYQLVAKHNQVLQALERIGGFTAPQVDPVLSIGASLYYRNKSTYPVGLRERQKTTHPSQDSQNSPKSIVHGQVIAGYYQKGSHQIVNLNQCPIQDKRLNPILEAVKQDIQKQKWPIYDETTHQGNIRHIGLRIGRRTGEILLTIVAKDRKLNQLWDQATAWMQRFGLVGVCLNLNSNKTNAIFGSETFCVAGRGYLEERFADLTFQIGPDSFFQVYTEQAEALLGVLQQELNLQGQEVLLDAYCGVGTLTLPLAKQAKQAIGIEVQPEAIDQARINALNNQIDNTEFHVGAVETLLPTLDIQPDVVLLDPPRKGCDVVVLETLLKLAPAQIAYMSCNPATLARDLKILCATGAYHLRRVQPADFFPQTSHVESVAFLSRVD